MRLLKDWPSFAEATATKTQAPDIQEEAEWTEGSISLGCYREACTHLPTSQAASWQLQECSSFQKAAAKGQAPDSEEEAVIRGTKTPQDGREVSSWMKNR